MKKCFHPVISVVLIMVKARMPTTPRAFSRITVTHSIKVTYMQGVRLAKNLALYFHELSGIFRRGAYSQETFLKGFRTALDPQNGGPADFSRSLYSPALQRPGSIATMAAQGMRRRPAHVLTWSGGGRHLSGLKVEVAKAAVT